MKRWNRAGAAALGVLLFAAAGSAEAQAPAVFKVSVLDVPSGEADTDWKKVELRLDDPAVMRLSQGKGKESWEIPYPAIIRATITRSGGDRVLVLTFIKRAGDYHLLRIEIPGGSLAAFLAAFEARFGRPPSAPESDTGVYTPLDAMKGEFTLTDQSNPNLPPSSWRCMRTGGDYLFCIPVQGTNGFLFVTRGRTFTHVTAEGTVRDGLIEWLRGAWQGSLVDGSARALISETDLTETMKQGKVEVHTEAGDSFWTIKRTASGQPKVVALPQTSPAPKTEPIRHFAGRTRLAGAARSCDWIPTGTGLFCINKGSGVSGAELWVVDAVWNRFHAVLAGPFAACAYDADAPPASGPWTWEGECRSAGEFLPSQLKVEGNTVTILGQNVGGEWVTLGSRTATPE